MSTPPYVSGAQGSPLESILLDDPTVQAEYASYLDQHSLTQSTSYDISVLSQSVVPSQAAIPISQGVLRTFKDPVLSSTMQTPGDLIAQTSHQVVFDTSFQEDYGQIDLMEEEGDSFKEAPLVASLVSHKEAKRPTKQPFGSGDLLGNLLLQQSATVHDVFKLPPPVPKLKAKSNIKGDAHPFRLQ